jgi:type I restriction enzyme, S subunit
MEPYVRTTAGQSNIGMEGLGQIAVPLPSRGLQERFADIVSKHSHLQIQQRETLRQAEQLFGALLERAFRGEL